MKLNYYWSVKVNNTEYAAQLMLDASIPFDASTLGKAMGITAQKASGLLYNIRHSSKYNVTVTPLPNRKVIVLDIANRKVKANLWRKAIFGAAA